MGLFGDTMQRIYTDGKLDLDKNIPDVWGKPEIKINYRCPKRVIKLINKIRSDVDNHEQIPKKDKEEGVVRLFLVSSDIRDKIALENRVAKKMSEIIHFKGD